ncbi:MAG: PcfJ domain-containing protein [Treponema sp.]|nr:PcfJ domain-containing protein [Treponema sp.]
MNRFWSFDSRNNSYTPTEGEPLSVFPTILDLKKKLVYCRRHKQWEKILGISTNKVMSLCGKIYFPPFMHDYSVFHYGYDVVRRAETYFVRVKSQKVATNRRQLVNTDFSINLEQKKIFHGENAVSRDDEIAGILCREVSLQIVDELSETVKNRFGYKPTVTSSLSGFPLILGYMLSPFNVNFYRISHHWGLNPYDADFTFLSSGDTPTAENEMFSSMGVKPTKTVRKLYQKFPEGMVAYAAMKDLGFSDPNLLQKSATKDFYKFFNSFNISFAGGDIAYGMRETIRLFVQDMLQIANQKTVWNSIERTVKFHQQKRNNSDFVIYGHSGIVNDAFNMYPPCAPHLSEREKHEILREGVNDYTHDFLLRRNRELQNEGIIAGKDEAVDRNVVFPLEQKFLDLEYKCGEEYKMNSATGKREKVPDEDRWCFYVAKDSDTLKTIGSEMSNCVGWGYKNAVNERRATIVYAMYKKQYKICIEVTPGFMIRQAFGPHNSNIYGEAQKAYSEWCREKNIVFRKVFSQRLTAP